MRERTRASSGEGVMMETRSVGGGAGGGTVAMETGRPDREAKAASRSFGTTLIFLAIAVALHVDNVVLGKYSYVAGKDWLGFDTPIKMAFAANIEKSGALAYWFPNFLGGIDGTSGGQALDLMFLPYLFLPHWAASFLDTTVTSFVAMVAMNALLRDLDVDAVPAFLGALVFGIFPIVAPYVGLGIAGMPVIALVVRRTVVQPVSLRAVLLWIATGIVISLASSFMLSFPYLVPLVALWVLALDPKHAARIILAFFVIGLCGVIVRLPLLLTLTETTPLSHRQDFNLAALYDGPVWAYLRNLYWHTFDYRVFAWVPIVAIVFFPRNRLLMTTVLIGLVVVLLAPGWDAFRAAFPGLGPLNGVNFRFQYSTAFFVAISVAVLLDAIGKRKAGPTVAAGGERWKAWPVAPICAALVALIIAVHVADAATADIDGWLHGGSVNAYLGRATLAQLPQPDKDPYRVVTVEVKGGPEMANFPAAYGLESADGYHNMYSIRYKRFWRAVIAPSLGLDPQRQNWFDNFGHFATLEIPEGAPQPVDLSKYFRIDLLSLANVRVVLSPVELTGFALEHKAREAVNELTGLRARIMRRLDLSLYGRDINIYRNTEALPRFRVVGKTRVYPSSDALLADIGNLPLQTLASTVLLDDADVVDVTDVKPGSGEVTLTAYRPDTFSLHTTTSSRQILVVSSNYYPAWQCLVDGKPSRVFPVYETFFGTVVDEGSHDVTCTYMPWMKRLSMR
jgi:Protein of unknown function (DUF6044)/Bacterial membrane protein YfhO